VSSRDSSKFRGIGEVVLWMGAIMLVLALSWDLYRFISTREFSVGWGTVDKSNPFYGDVEILIKQIDRTRNRLVVDVTATVRSSQPTSLPGMTIQKIALTLLAPKKGVEILKAQQPFTKEAEEPTPTGDEYSKIVQNFSNVELPIDGATAEEIYPFDSVELSLSPRLCVNEPNNQCSKLSSARMPVQIHVDLDYQVRRGLGLRLRGDERTDRLDLAIGRQSFIRISAIYFMVLGVAILYFLYRQQKARDLMLGALGLFGGLWGFRQVVVPSDVKIFPTLIDYFVLLSFGLVFFLVIHRLAIKGEGS
jgi:hypothetical protein